MTGGVCLRGFPNYEFYLRDGKLNCYGKYGKKMKQDGCHKNGYWDLKLYDKDGKQKHLKVARLTMMLFGDEPQSEKHNTVDHIDRDRKNDHISNLRWATRREQVFNRNFYGKGYCWRKGKKKWQVEFKSKHICYCKTEEEAKAKIAEVRAKWDSLNS
jgi:hypothetical protein